MKMKHTLIRNGAIRQGSWWLSIKVSKETLGSIELGRWFLQSPDRGRMRCLQGTGSSTQDHLLGLCIPCLFDFGSGTLAIPVLSTDCLVVPIWKGLLDTRRLCIIDCLPTDGCICLVGLQSNDLFGGWLWEPEPLSCPLGRCFLSLEPIRLGHVHQLSFQSCFSNGTSSSHLVTGASRSDCRGAMVTSWEYYGKWGVYKG